MDVGSRATQEAKAEQSLKASLIAGLFYFHPFILSKRLQLTER
jgi:hypothetical protein